MPTHELLICYLWDGQKLSIWSYFDKKDRNIYDWQEIIKKSVNVKAKMTCQPISIAWKYNAHYHYSNKPMKRDFKNKKDSKVKKIPNTFTNHNTNGDGQAS